MMPNTETQTEKMTQNKTAPPAEKTRKPSRNMKSLPRTSSRPNFNPSNLMQRILPEELFLGMLCFERKRAERSGKKFFLLLLNAQEAIGTSRQATIFKGIVKAAESSRRETDLAGWYRDDAILGVIFTELGALGEDVAVAALLDKLHRALAAEMTPRDLKMVEVSLHTFADDSEDDDSNISANPTFYPDLLHQRENKKFSFMLKRVMDVVGSSLAILAASPVLCLIALLVKMTSKGPVLFKQPRLGQFGNSFTFLKFRSMYVNNDLKIHQEFMKNLIGGGHDGAVDPAGKPVYKMKNDPRVTRVGRFLRRSSLDELPQFFNVLRGEMSLVGPRPPLEYEYEEYDVWHRRRVLEIKPGITGLWQVRGRSRVRFDDMVRLDLQYARGWSLWLDVQILAETPRAVLLGDGAF
jgi:lipopolysaccharide/colanic/teichoic acid biosynthesis glycosyltransferase